MMSYAGSATPQFTIELVRPCQICARATTLWCSRCRDAFYCSAEHITADWPRHKFECKPVGNIPPPSPPLPPSSQSANFIADLQSVVQALWFPPNEESFVNVNVVCNILKGEKPTSLPVLDRFLPASDMAFVTLSTGLNGLTLRCPLQIWYSPAMLRQGVPANRSIGKITHGMAERSWPGTVLVLKFAGKTMKEHVDVDTANDLPAVVDFFIDHRRWPSISNSQ
ncbi:hypothetical protein CPB83DRAFT_851604 [Crepidotus variabilis]|uniref:MYND-type domain-containing protein n=1 Tax=Crepidotus variabilis TaxID=179855 RepID=A0A9P6EJP5_9AGAR|nr:hypothetical protein CPB83DRAFT_851604 [Crepidotus variabilis]